MVPWLWVKVYYLKLYRYVAGLGFQQAKIARWSVITLHYFKCISFYSNWFEENDVCVYGRDLKFPLTMGLLKEKISLHKYGGNNNNSSGLWLWQKKNRIRPACTGWSVSSIRLCTEGHSNGPPAASSAFMLLPAPSPACLLQWAVALLGENVRHSQLSVLTHSLLIAGLEEKVTYLLTPPYKLAGTDGDIIQRKIVMLSTMKCAHIVIYIHIYDYT